jgi:AraC family transcriptional regulator
MKPATRSFYGQAVQRAIEHIVVHLDESLDQRAVVCSPRLRRKIHARRHQRDARIPRGVDSPHRTPQDRLRSDAAISVSEHSALPPQLAEQRIAAGTYARTVHRGPYDTLGDMWARFMGDWLPASGRRVGPGVSYEIYRNNPTNTPKEQLVTELYVPVIDGSA